MPILSEHSLAPVLYDAYTFDYFLNLQQMQLVRTCVLRQSHAALPSLELNM